MDSVNLLCPQSAGWQRWPEECIIINDGKSHAPDMIRKQGGIEFYECETTSKVVELSYHILLGAVPKAIPNL